MTFIYGNFNSEVINARKFKKFAKKESDNYDISARCSEAFIKKNVPVSDNEIIHFKSKYRPTIEQIRTYSDYEMIDYIKNGLHQEGFKIYQIVLMVHKDYYKSSNQEQEKINITSHDQIKRKNWFYKKNRRIIADRRFLN